ncbi:SDR family NAD(P)-dependent oxidoreductase [Rhodococcus sp. JVH1]|uniref:SDR family NAD(P)-dependent oxidoreductase n=1 Tax=Rhodococcus sp. JVH1 TaxID=745408 RepID=UPI0002722285|nr:SDR family oxidoreductase [Rhodococcus sp. JVH1]EJI95632.1 short chain dehydrogenase family protein [Rhodococcus sp. JVH1]
MNAALAGLRAVVTGAGRGIGRATAIALAEQGADVAVVDIDLRSGNGTSVEKSDSTTEAVAGLGSRTMGLEVDLTEESSATTVISAVLEEWGGFDILVNVAGGAITSYEGSRASVTSPADIRKALDVNLMSAIYLCQASVSTLRASASPSIVNITSLSAEGVLPGGSYAGYALAKAALAHYTRYLAEDLGQYSIRVNAVSPGYIMTDRVRANSVTTGFADKASHSALGRLGEPEDVARTIAFLASPNSSYVTGHILAVDGMTRLA